MQLHALGTGAISPPNYETYGGNYMHRFFSYYADAKALSIQLSFTGAPALNPSFASRRSDIASRCCDIALQLCSIALPLVVSL